MAKSLEQIQAQIAKLQREAEALKAKEVGGVIARIKEAIAHYGLTAVDLGLESRRGRKPGSKNRPANEKAPTSPAKSPAKAGTATKSAKKATTKKPLGVPKYTDGAGKTWTGKGTRPKWFVAAIAGGKTAEDLLIKAAA